MNILSNKWTYYNEFDPKAAAWLRQLIKNGDIADGVVDERSITEVEPADLKQKDQDLQVSNAFCREGGGMLDIKSKPFQAILSLPNFFRSHFFHGRVCEQSQEPYSLRKTRKTLELKGLPYKNGYDLSQVVFYPLFFFYTNTLCLGCFYGTLGLSENHESFYILLSIFFFDLHPGWQKTQYCTQGSILDYQYLLA